MGKKLILFVDDLNMPRVDLYGTQQPIALLKLFIEKQGLYDKGKELNWKNMKDIEVRVTLKLNPLKLIKKTSPFSKLQLTLIGYG